MIVLNRLEITGILHDNTPLIVIEDILKAHSIGYEKDQLTDRRYISKILDTIQSKSKPTIETPYSRNTYMIIANFINPDVVLWNKQEVRLIEALDFLLSWNTRYEIPNFFITGNQTPDNPFSLCSSVVYRLCCAHGILTFRNTTIDQMDRALNLYIKDISVIRSSLGNIIEKSNKETLVNMVVLSNIPKSDIENIGPKDRIDYYLLIQAMQTLGRYNLERILPYTNNEAVVLAAVNFKIDISSNISPYREYLSMCSTKILSGYKFLDIDQRSLSGLNPLIFDLSFNFNPMLPLDLYTTEDLRKMNALEGYPANEDVESIYGNLQYLSLSNNFYLGIFPKIISNSGKPETSIFFDNITDHHWSNLICYGIKDTFLNIYTWEELLDLFKNTRKLNGADDRKLENIRKLKNLCLLKDPRIKANPETRENLYKIISDIEFENLVNTEKLLCVKRFFGKADENEKIKVVSLLQQIFELGMIMRGWNKKEPLPVEYTPTIDLGVIEERLFVGFEKFNQELSSASPEIQELINFLPLVKLNNGIFIVSTDEHECLTVMKRLELARSGESVSNMSSCIRLTSNWIVSSGYCYLQSVGMPPVFDLSTLSYVS